MGKKILLAILVLSLMMPLSAIAGELRFGILPRLTIAEMEEGFAPLASYLSRELGVKVTLVVPKDFDTWRKDAAARKYDIVYTNPYLYVLLKRDVPETELLAIASEPGGLGPTIRGAIVVRKDSPIKSVADLRGKTVAATDAGSAGAYISQMLMLHRGGVKKGDVNVIFLKRRDPVADAVLKGKAAAGFIRHDDVARIAAGPDNFRILAVSDPIPNWPIAISDKMDPAMAKRLRDAILRLRPGDLASVATLGPARIVGFVPVTDKEYDIMREAARALGEW